MRHSGVGVALFLVASLAAAADGPVAPPPRPIRIDLVGDRLPPGAVARLGTARLRHADSVHDLAFSADGKRLAVTADDGSVSVWDTDTGKLLGRAKVGVGAAVGFAAADGVGTFTPGTGLRVFEPDAGKLLRSAASERSVGGRGVAAGRQPAPVLAPGLRWMAYREGETGDFGRCRVVVVDPTTDREVTALPLRHKGWVTQVGFSPDGGLMVVGDGESDQSTIWVFDPASKKVAFERKVEGLYPRSVSLSRGGERVMAAMMPHGGTATAAARVWDAASGKVLLDRPVKQFSFCSAALAPDGKTVAVLEQRTVTLVDVDTGKVVKTLETRWEFGRLFFSPDGGKLAVAANGRAVDVFDVASGRVVPGRDKTFDPDGRYINLAGRVRFRPDSTILAHLADEPGMSLWDPLTGRRLESVPLPQGGWYARELSPDGKRLIYSAGRAATVGEFRVWDRERREDVATSAFPGVVGPRFDFTSDGRLFLHPDHLTPDSPEVWELDPVTLKRVGQWIVPGGPFCKGELWGRRVSADGRRRFEMVADDQHRPKGTIRQWDVIKATEGAVIRWAPAESLSADENRIGEVRYLRTTDVSRDGRWLAVLQYIGHRGEANPDGRDRVSGGEFVAIFDTTDGRERVRFPIRYEPGADVISGGLAVSPDGRLVTVSRQRGTCRVYETASGTDRMKVPHHIPVSLFSPDSRLLLTWDWTEAGLIWDLREPVAGQDSDDKFPSGGMKAVWQSLADPSATAAYPAVVWLTGQGDEAVKFLAGAVRPTPIPTPEEVSAWVRQLGAEEFRDREAAEERLRWVAGHHAARFGETLRRAAVATDSPEVGRRLKQVLANLDRFAPLPEEVRAARAVEILERIGSPAARKALSTFAGGSADAWLTRDASAALARMEQLQRR